MKHIIATTTVSAAVTAGVAFAVYTYKSEAKFNPADIDRKMNVNQVLFDGNEIKNKSNDNRLPAFFVYSLKISYLCSWL